MKKNIASALISAVLLCLTYTASAIPAKKGVVLFTQPDGNQVSILVHGDEWFHYVTDLSGNLMEENAAGFMVKSNKSMLEIEEKMSMAKVVRNNIFQLQQQQQINKAMVTGSPKIPVVLVQFSDKEFSISNPKTAFTNLLTQAGYSANGGTGSVLDYYLDQSRGKYSPQFVVMDVVTLSGTMSTYGSTDEYAAKALYEACQKLDATVDFSQFDNDHDGKIDMALLYFAGYNEAEGGPSSTIWPHQFYVPYVVTNAQAFDGVKLDRYFCTSELKGYSGTNMCGIGTTCHEFAHSLGLPDMYDTNYNEYGDGEAGATYGYDVMCSGSYNNNGCTPPYMNAEELMMLGWMDEITELTTTGNVTLPSIASDQPVAYKTPTTANGEYFLYESRPGTGWDKPLKSGLLVYHVDKSPDHNITFKRSSSQSTTQTAYNLWANWEQYNAINCNGSHPCFYIVPAGNQSSLNYSGSAFTFPGTSNITNYTPKDWAGKDTGFSLSSISFNSTEGSVSFRLANTNECSVSGMVMDSDSNPISGATVTISTAATSNASSALHMLRAGGTPIATLTTDSNGSYSYILDNAGTYLITAEKEGYVSKSVSVAIGSAVSQNFYLLREGEEAPSEIYTYPDDADWGDYGSNQYSSWDIMCADVFPTSMIGAYAGKQIKSISFCVAGEDNTKGTIDAIIDFGSERKAVVRAEKPVPNGWTTVDLTAEELIIPEGKEIFAGFALKSWAYSYPLTAANPASADRTGYMIMEYNLSNTNWEAWDYVFKIKLNIGDFTPADSGYNSIADPKGGIYDVGDRFDLVLNETGTDRRPDEGGVEWYYDDEPVNDYGSITFGTAGVHNITARFVTVTGELKVVELEVSVR